MGVTRMRLIFDYVGCLDYVGGLIGQREVWIINRMEVALHDVRGWGHNCLQFSAE